MWDVSSLCIQRALAGDITADAAWTPHGINSVTTQNSMYEKAMLYISFTIYIIYL